MFLESVSQSVLLYLTIFSHSSFDHGPAFGFGGGRGAFVGCAVLQL